MPLNHWFHPPIYFQLSQRNWCAWRRPTSFRSYLFNLEKQLEIYPVSGLSQLEIDGLLYMSEEEKLAHDVYSVLYGATAQRIFTNIASSEITHAEAVQLLLNRYGLDDPAAGKGVGVFENSELQNLNDLLFARGSALKGYFSSL